MCNVNSIYVSWIDHIYCSCVANEHAKNRTNFNRHTIKILNIPQIGFQFRCLFVLLGACNLYVVLFRRCPYVCIFGLFLRRIKSITIHKDMQTHNERMKKLFYYQITRRSTLHHPIAIALDNFFVASLNRMACIRNISRFNNWFVYLDGFFSFSMRFLFSIAFDRIDFVSFSLPSATAHTISCYKIISPDRDFGVVCYSN